MDPNTLNPADVWNLIVANPFAAGVFLLLVISEALASVKSIQANSIFQVIYGLLKKLGPAPKPPVATLLLAIFGCASV